MEQTGINVPIGDILAALKGIEIKYARGSKLFNAIQQYKKGLVIDLRPAEAFRKSHFSFSVNLPVNSMPLADLMKMKPSDIQEKMFPEKKDKDAFAARKRLVVFIVPSLKSVQEYSANPHKISDTLAFEPEKRTPEYNRAKGFLYSLILYAALKQEKIRELYILNEGFQTLQANYPFMCLFYNNAIYLEPKTKSYPNEILQGKLFLGDQYDAKDISVLKNLKITHVVNATSEIQNHFENEGILYMRAIVLDNNETKIHYYFPRIYGFIDSAIFETKEKVSPSASPMKKKIVESGKASTGSYSIARKSLILGLESLMQESIHKIALKRNPEEISTAFDRMMEGNTSPNRILVHCARGISRSASIVIMYIMKKFDVSFDSALAFVQSRREIVEPNEGFREQLLEFEKSKYTFFKELGLKAPSLPPMKRRQTKTWVSGIE